MTPETVRRVASALSAGLTAAVALAATVTVVWAVAAPGIVERLIRDAAAAQGIALSDVEVVAVTPTRLEMTGLSVAGEGPSLRRVVATYAPGRLWRERRLDTVRVDGLRGRISVGPDGIRIPGVPLPDGQDDPDPEPARLPVPPVDRVTLDDARLALATPAGDLALSAEATLATGRDGAATLTAAGALDGPWGPSALELDASVDAGGAIEAGLRLSAGRLAGAWGSVAGVDAWAVLAGRPGDWRRTGVQALADRLTVPAGAVDADLHSVSVVAGGAPWPKLLSIRGRLGTAARVAADLALSPEAEDGPLTLDFDIASEALEETASIIGMEDLPLSGRGRLAGHLETAAAAWWPLPDVSDGLPPGASVVGMLDLALSDAGSAPGASGIEADVAAGLRVEGSRLALVGRRPWRVAVPSLGGAPPLAVRLGGEDDAFSVALERDGAGSGWRADVGGPVGLTAGDGTEAAGGALSGRLAVTATKPAGGPLRLDLEDLSVSGGPVAYRDLAVSVDSLAVEGSATPAGGRVRADGRIGVEGSFGTVAMTGGRIDGRLTLAWDGGSASVDADGCLTVSADRLAVGDATAEAPVFCLTSAGEAPLIRAGRGGGGRSAPVVEARVTGEAADWRVPGLGVVAVTPPVVTVSGTLPVGQAAGRLTVAGTDGAARSDAIGLAVSGVAVEAVRDPGTGSALDLALDIGEARLLRRPAPLVPVRVRAAGGLDEAGVLRLSGQAVGAGGGLTADLSLSHDAASGRGGVTVAVPSLAFAPEVRQPADVFPILATAPLTAVTGSMSGRASFAWHGGVTSGGELVLEDLAVETPFAAAEGLSGTLSAGSLVPPVLPPGQEIAVDLVDIGLLLENGRVRFGYGADGRLSVAALGFDWADGRLEAEPFAGRLDDRALDVVLTASDVDVATLLVAVPLEGFEATGRLQGRVPVRLTPDTIVIDNAVLETAGPGVIRYRPEGGAEGVAAADRSGGLSLLLQALRDFRYETLKLTLDGRTGEDLSATVSVLGANPDLYDGWPVALDVNVGGELDRILRSGLRSLSLGRRTEDILRGRIERAIEGGVLDAPAPGGE